MKSTFGLFLKFDENTLVDENNLKFAAVSLL